jgi:hypothetical protein
LRSLSDPLVSKIYGNDWIYMCSVTGERERMMELNLYKYKESYREQRLCKLTKHDREAKPVEFNWLDRVD